MLYTSHIARPTALSIAGSDSGGGAGLQADTRTFQRLGAFGTTAVTAVTAQNLSGVRAIAGIEAEVVVQQIEAVMDGFDVAAVKTGMLWSAATVRAVARLLRTRSKCPIVVDPVMVATSGAPLLAVDALTAYTEELIPGCTLLTPNLDEAALLLKCGTISQDQLEERAQELSARFGCAVLLKGGHLQGDPIDVLCRSESVLRWHHPRLMQVNTHGTGCMLSAAITAFLARDLPLEQACSSGLAFVHDALARASRPSAPPQHLADIEAALSDAAPQHP